MDFSSGPQIRRCDMCGWGIEVMGEKVAVEGHNFHKECFKCAICDTQLSIGACATDHVLYRYFGPIWFCNTHMMLGSGEKYEMMKAKLAAKKTQTNAR